MISGGSSQPSYGDDSCRPAGKSCRLSPAGTILRGVLDLVVDGRKAKEKVRIPSERITLRINLPWCGDTHGDDEPRPKFFRRLSSLQKKK